MPIHRVLILCLLFTLGSCAFNDITQSKPQNYQKIKDTARYQIQSKAYTTNKNTCHNPDFKKQVTLGYQGWFAAKGDGVSNNWKHWSKNNKMPSVNHVTFELYPDISEYRPTDLFLTKLGKLGNGKPAKLFSSARDGVVDLHFQWMRDYQLDGIALQRFSSELKNKNSMKHNDRVTQLVKKYSEQYCRTFYIMYDVSSSPVKGITQRIKNDWSNIMEKKLQVTQSAQYAHYQGKPVIGLWGFGFNTDAHQFSKQQAQELIKWFRNKGFYIVGGVPYNWRLGKLDSRKNWLPIYKQYDMLLPWSVGRYRKNNELLGHYKSIWKQDLVYSKRNKLEMKRVIFPGFAWSNWNNGSRNEIPRKRGSLMWKQAYLTHQLGLGVYIAMFDEYDEGTAIAKAATTQAMLPRQQYFLSLSEDGYKVSSDFYLRLSRSITQMIHGQKFYGKTVPIK